MENPIKIMLGVVIVLSVVTLGYNIYQNKKEKCSCTDDAYTKPTEIV